LYGDVVMGILFSFVEAAILYEEKLILPGVKQERIVFTANNSPYCECHEAATKR
jgi:hypothetical protein